MITVIGSVTFDGSKITLNTFGNDDRDTRRRINLVAKDWRLGFKVYRERGISKVCILNPDNTPYLNVGPLVDRMTFNTILHPR